MLLFCMACGQLVTNEMAVRLLFEKDKVVGVETIPSPRPKRGGEDKGLAWGSSQVAASIARPRGARRSTSRGRK